MDRATSQRDETGARLVEKARGALGHWIIVRGGRIAACQIIAPTGQNFSPRFATGRPGPVKAARERAIMRSGEISSLSVQRVGRSFDG